ncbi:MAG: lamin tail domain-containing protein [Flavisolibacter sp.]|nr:lamin tail domain-containing protein [Flavisolibacter sp.]
MITRWLPLLLLLTFNTSGFSQVIQRYDVVISEIMADPTPQVGLPNAEYIELKNVSGRPINLAGWRISTSTSTSGAFPSFQLEADSFVILTTTTQATNFMPFGKVLAVPSFPALPNDGSVLTLRSNEGRTIHSVEYNMNWYQNELKREGGWSLEMIDVRNPCSGTTNWKASTDPSGGTPGKKNSVDAINPDKTPPRLLRTYSLDSVTIVAVFDEPLDSLFAATINNYSISNNIAINSASPVAPLFSTVILKLASPILPGTTYTLNVTNLHDCSGNVIGIHNHSKVGSAQEPLPFDIIINEILFNPKPNGYDFVEFYNRSNKILDLSKLSIANRNSAGSLASIRKLTTTPYLLFPGEYIVVTENPASLSTLYFVPEPSRILTLSLPSYPNTNGTVVLLNEQGTIVDEVSYSEKWHFDLITNREGISLERIDPSGPSNNPSNWHSAASTAGYATPGYKNSQFLQANRSNIKIEVLPKVFSPDGDGYDDFAIINYNVNEPGFVANITIFDAAGRPVKQLARNNLMGVSGSWKWDGLDDKGSKLSIGTYIIFIELHNLQGKKEQIKKTIVLARRL